MGALVERVGAVALITINRPQARNALDAATSAAIDALLTEAEADDGVGAIVLTGAGDRAFCAGMDLKEAAAIGVGHGLIPGRGFAGVTERRFKKPVIAAVNGAAVAGGFEIALACDIVVAADHAVFGLPEVKRGLFAFAGGVQRLARLLPRSAAMSVILSGEPVSAQRMYELGVVSALVPAADLRRTALDLADGILANSWAALRNAKALYEFAADAPLDQSLRFGATLGFATLSSHDSHEGSKAFAEGRKAEFRD